MAKGPEWSDDTTAQQLAKRLGVKALVNGSLRTDGAKIRITAEIISADGFQIWTDKFDRAAEDIFQLQEIVATEVRKVLLGEPGEQIRAAGREPNPEAFTTYTRGLFFLEKRDIESLQSAADLFRETIKHDRDFGPAYLRLAITYLLLADYTVEQRRHLFQQAIEIANQGVKADPGIRAPAAMIHGFVEHQFGNWAAASDAFAIALGGVTVYPTAYNWHSRLLSALGLLDKSLQQAKVALAKEPASQVLNARMASAYFWIDDMANARLFFEEANKMEVGAPIHHFAYTMFLIRDNRIEEARASAKHAYQLLQGTDDWWIDPVFDKIAQPDNQEIRKIAFETVDKMIAESVAPYITMSVLALFEQGDRVMEFALNIADSGTLYESDSAQVEIIYLNELKLLREHEGFPTLLQNLGLTDYWASIGCRWADDQVLCDSTWNLSQNSS
uniref:Putative transcriptional regulator n=1 Tax=uncultured marine microorganism TaxID=415540 RepID=A5CFS7_9ZZZZ|nr:putative transcriptional regulator [uncultured marine microorganism]